MSKNLKQENQENKEKPTPDEIEFPTDVLVKSKAFKDYHPCFVRALLPKESYTKTEALKIVKSYFGGK